MRDIKYLLIDIVKKEEAYLITANKNDKNYSKEHIRFGSFLGYVSTRSKAPIYGCYYSNYDPSKDPRVINYIQNLIIRHPEFLDGFTDDEKLLLNITVI